MIKRDTTEISSEQAEHEQTDNLKELSENPDMKVASDASSDVRQPEELVQNPHVKSRREKVRVIFGNIGFGLCVAALICSVALLVFALFMRNSEQKTGIGGYGLFEVVSGSMEPEIKAGDVIIGKRVNSVSELTADGSMNIIFEYDGKTVIHKLIAIDGTTLTTHGVANPEGANETIDFSRVVAVQKARLPSLGYVLDFVREPYGYIIIVALPLIGVIGYETRKIVNTLKSDKADSRPKNADSPDCAVSEVGGADTESADESMSENSCVTGDTVGHKSADSVSVVETREIAALKAERDELIKMLNNNRKKS